MANISVPDTGFDKAYVQAGRRYVPALIVLAVLYFMMGFITCLNDTLVPFFKKGFTLTYTESSFVQFYFFLTYGIMSIPSGRIVERIGYQKGMVLGFVLAAAGALMFLPASAFHRYFLFLMALFVLAIGIVLLQVAANPYITVLGPPETASARLTLIQGVGSLGTTVAPLFGAGFILSALEPQITDDALKYPYLGIAIVLMLIAAIVFFLKLPSFSGAKGAPVQEDDHEVKGLFSFRNLNFGVPAIFLYVGAEVSIGSFLTNYIADLLHIAEKSANSFVAFYWGSMLVGRFLGSVVLKYVRPSKVLRACAVLAVVLILLSVNSSGYWAAWFMISVGLCNSVMFAIIFSMSVSGLKSHTTKASGLLSTAIVGGAVVSLLTGVLKDHFTWYAAFFVPLVCYVYILFYGMYGFRSKHSRLS